MAYEYVYWPESLPRKALLDSFSPTVPSSITRSTPDMGLPLQRTRGDYPASPISCTYVMTREQLDTFSDFCKSIGGRSFWMPYPDPLNLKFTKDKWWYARINPSSDEAIATPSAIGGGKFEVSLQFDFWTLKPGEVPPFLAGGGD